MTREEIKKAAEQNISCNSPLDLGAILEGVGRESFVCGAEWRIKSVWHDALERPDERRGVIIEYGENRISLHEKGYDGPWKYNVEQFGFKRWAYVEDLKPNTEECL